MSMPIYEYVCPECGARFEKLRRMSQADVPATCAVCGNAHAPRAISSFAAGGCGPGGGGRFR